MTAEDILDNLRRCIREREKAAVGFSVQTEVNGCFLELTGIPDERIASEKIQKAMTEANIYNARSFLGKIIITEELRQVCFRMQYVLPDAENKAADITAEELKAVSDTAEAAGDTVETDDDAVEAAAIGETLAEYLFRQMNNLTQWISALNTDGGSENKLWLSDSRPQALFDIRDKFFKPCEVYDRLKDTLDRYHVRYETVPNCMEVCCEWSRQEASESRETEGREMRGRQISCRVSVDSRHGVLQFLAVMKAHVPEEQMMKYSEICMAVNRDIWGQFYINAVSGRVCYDLTTPYHNGPVTPDWIARQIAAAEHAIGIWRQKEMGER